jgi:hypothetical protein
MIPASELTAVPLDDVIASFGGLVALILALITLFTGTREAVVRELEARMLTKQSQRELKTETWLAGALFGATVLLLATGIPLWVRTLAHWSWSTDHSVRWVFLVAWALLVPLAVWQLNIARRASAKARGAV